MKLESVQAFPIDSVQALKIDLYVMTSSFVEATFYLICSNLFAILTLEKWKRTFGLPKKPSKLQSP